jgi:peptidoglycan/xylan/chitin deacetylase (PgdA/CDA1 family)
MRDILKDTALHISKALGLFALARWLTSDALRVLAYHGFELSDETLFRPHLFIRLPDFARRMELLAKGYPVLPLGDALDKLTRRELPSAAVAITIDDGFYGVRAAAAEILKRHGFPATVYVTTYYAEREAPIFRLVVRYMFERTSADRLNWPGKEWLPDTGVDLRREAARQQAAEAVIEFGESRCTEIERQDICRELGRLLAVDYEHIRRTRILSLMNGPELRELAGFGIDVQLHTHRHRFPLHRQMARTEVLENRRALSALLDGGSFEHFCYPSGEYSPCQWPWLEELGVKSATSCEPGLNYPGTPQFGVRRFLDDSKVSSITFEAELSGFLELTRRGRARIRRCLGSLSLLPKRLLSIF